MKRTIAYGALAVAVIGCGGKGSGSVSSSTDLSGTINAADFSVPAGETRRVTGNLKVLATNTIKIDGTLVVNPGVNVALSAGNSIAVTGQFKSGSGGLAPEGRGYGANHVLFVSKSVTMGGTIHQFAPGVNVAFLGGTGTGNALTISSSLSIQKAAPGSGRNAAGANGGAILIGSQQALAIAAGESIPAGVPNTVTINGSLNAGDGGLGGDDVSGIVTGRSTSCIGGRGGDGGSIEVTAVNSVDWGIGSSAKPGKGGDGGWCGRVYGAGTGWVKGADGSAIGENGGDVSATGGTGGNAGTMTVTSPATSGTPSLDVNIGGQGGCPFVKGGNGGPAGNGSNLNIVIGLCGLNSDGNRVTNATAAEILEGYGGTGTASLPGGNGGQVNITSNGSPNIYMIDCLRGGDGFDGSSLLPVGPGTNGGSGGTVVCDGTPTYTYRSLNGGDGGSHADASPATSGGTKGTSNSTPTGLDGFPGLSDTEAKQNVLLARDIALTLTTSLRGGTTVSLGRFRQFTIALPNASCGQKSLHGDVYVNGYGPIADPAPNGCGHGTVN